MQFTIGEMRAQSIAGACLVYSGYNTAESRALLVPGKNCIAAVKRALGAQGTQTRSEALMRGERGAQGARLGTGKTRAKISEHLQLRLNVWPWIEPCETSSKFGLAVAVCELETIHGAMQPFLVFIPALHGRSQDALGVASQQSLHPLLQSVFGQVGDVRAKS